MNLITAIRFYQNTNVADGYACVSSRRRQASTTFAASRRPAARVSTSSTRDHSGWTSSRGLRTFRFGCRENPHGIEFDLLWDASPRPHGTRQPGTDRLHRRPHRLPAFQLRSDRAREWQPCEVAGRKFEVGPEWVGARDHSWGLGGDSGTGGKIGTDSSPTAWRPEADTRAHKPNFGMRHWSLLSAPRSAPSTTGSTTATTAT